MIYAIKKNNGAICECEADSFKETDISYEMMKGGQIIAIYAKSGFEEPVDFQDIELAE